MNNLIASLLDPAARAECLGFIRTAIATADRQTAQDIAGILKECCQNGYVDRAALWAELSQDEQTQFKELLAPPPLARDFAKRIREAIGYNSPAVASAIQNNLEDAIDAGIVTVAEVLAVVGAAEFGEFDRLQKLTKINES